MWTLITGWIMSFVFEYLIVNVYMNYLITKKMSIVNIIFGWFLQEHIKEDFNMTGGKRFMLKRDFRNRFLTQTIKIVRNSIFWIHFRTILELGTFIILFLAYFYIILTTFIIFLKKPNKTELIYRTFLNIIIFSIFFSIFKLTFLQVYCWFDLVFVVRPFILIFLLIVFFYSIIIISYLVYLFLLRIFFNKIAILIKFLKFKNLFYLISFSLIFLWTHCEIYLQNISTGNFLKEILVKLICIILNYY